MRVRISSTDSQMATKDLARRDHCGYSVTDDVVETTVHQAKPWHFHAVGRLRHTRIDSTGSGNTSWLVLDLEAVRLNGTSMLHLLMGLGICLVQGLGLGLGLGMVL